MTSSSVKLQANKHVSAPLEIDTKSTIWDRNLLSVRTERMNKGLHLLSCVKSCDHFFPVKSVETGSRSQFEIVRVFWIALNSIRVQQEYTFQTCDQWCHHAFPVPSSGRLKNFQTRLFSDVCGQVRANGFQIDTNINQCADSICARFEIDDVIRLVMTVKKHFFLWIML